MQRRPAVIVGASVGVLALLVVAAVVALRPANAEPDLDPYSGLGAWIDVFDYAPRLQSAGNPPRVTPDSIDDLAALGARTLYLQVANPDDAPSDQLTDRKRLRAIVRRAHANNLMVVAWFLPYVTDLAKDEQVVRQLTEFRAGGRGFDAIALDIEDTNAVPDVQERNDRVVELARRTRALMDDEMALGAIVYPPVQLEVVNPVLWPDFPYQRLGESVDVWLPMAYFTYRDHESGYRDAFNYSEESVARLRANLGDDSAHVHLIGGIADQVTPADIAGFLRAVRDTGSVGYSMYDFATTSSAAWPHLRAGADRD